MMTRRLLLLSNSTNVGQGFLEHATYDLKSFLEPAPDPILFIPFAAVRLNYDAFLNRVAVVMKMLGREVAAVGDFDSAAEAVAAAGTVMVGGGNTFMLVHQLYETGMMEPLRERVQAGLPYIGWSAGSNIAAPTLCTTNDMPIVQPRSFQTLEAVPFQINPHFTDAVLPNHGGETRSERIEEYLIANPDRLVLGIPEGGMLEVLSDEVSLKGPYAAKLFRYQQEPLELQPGSITEYLR